MKNIYKKFIVILLTLAICGGSFATVFAAEQPMLTTVEQAELSVALQGIEMQKDRLGLSDTDFCNLQVGEQVQTYIYINNEFEPAHSMYPILDGESLILWAIENEGKFQIATGLVDEVNNFIDSNDAFAIVYDKTSAYLYSNNTFSFLKASDSTDDSRSVLDPNVVSWNADLVTASFSENMDLTYSPSVAREQIYYECDVDFVTQSSYDICWAATVACIANYINGTTMSAFNVAIDYYGEAYYNNGLQSKYIPEVLEMYDINYVYKNEAPSDGVILNNIQKGYPLYAGWITNSTAGHATCIYGINIMGSYIYIMDPNAGFVSVSYGSSGYSYVSPSTGSVFVLDKGVCRTWEIE